MAGRAELHLRRRRLRTRAAAALVAAALVAGCGDDDGGASKAELGVAVPWAKAAPIGNDVRIGYETDPCTRARRARVDDREGVVEVTLGDPERDPKKACVGVVERHCVLVALDTPLAGRKVVDGAAGPRRRNSRIPIEQYGACRPVAAAG